MKSTYNAQTREGKKKLKEKHKLNALIAEFVNDALQAKKKKRRAARCEVERKLHAFNDLEISSKGNIDTDDESSVASGWKTGRRERKRSSNFNTLDDCLNEHTMYSTFCTKVAGHSCKKPRTGDKY